MPRINEKSTSAGRPQWTQPTTLKQETPNSLELTSSATDGGIPIADWLEPTKAATDSPAIERQPAPVSKALSASEQKERIHHIGFFTGGTAFACYFALPQIATVSGVEALANLVLSTGCGFLITGTLAGCAALAGAHCIEMFSDGAKAAVGPLGGRGKGMQGASPLKGREGGSKDMVEGQSSGIKIEDWLNPATGAKVARGKPEVTPPGPTA